MPDDRARRGSRLGGGRDHRETRLELAQRIGNAYGLVLILVMITFAATTTLPPEGWGGRVAAVAIAGLTAIIAFTSSDVRPARVRLAALVVVAAVVAAHRRAGFVRSPARHRVHRRRDPAGDRGRHDPAARHRRASHVDFRTILGAVSVYALLGLLFAFFYFAVGRWSDGEFFTGVTESRSSDYLFFSYTTLTTTGYGNLIPAGRVGQSFAVFEMLLGQSSSSRWSPGS